MNLISNITIEIDSTNLQEMINEAINHHIEEENRKHKLHLRQKYISGLNLPAFLVNDTVEDDVNPFICDNGNVYVNSEYIIEYSERFPYSMISGDGKYAICKTGEFKIFD